MLCPTRDRNDGQVLRYVAALRDGRPDDHRPVDQASRAHGDHGTRNGVRVLGPAAVFRPLQSADDRVPHKHRAGRDGDIVVFGPEKQIHYVLIRCERRHVYKICNLFFAFMWCSVEVQYIYIRSCVAYVVPTFIYIYQNPRG